MAQDLAKETQAQKHNVLPQGEMVRKAIERLEPYEDEVKSAKETLRDKRSALNKMRKSIKNELNVDLKYFDLARELTRERDEDEDATEYGADGVRQLVCCVAAMDQNNQFDWIKQIQIDDSEDA